MFSWLRPGFIERLSTLDCVEPGGQIDAPEPRSEAVANVSASDCLPKLSPLHECTLGVGACCEREWRRIDCSARRLMRWACPLAHHIGREAPRTHPVPNGRRAGRGTQSMEGATPPAGPRLPRWHRRVPALERHHLAGKRPRGSPRVHEGAPPRTWVPTESPRGPPSQNSHNAQNPSGSARQGDSELCRRHQVGATPMRSSG